MPESRVLTADFLMGSRVRDRNGQELGTIENLVIDHERRQGLYLLLSIDGLEDRLFPVPWRAVRRTPEGLSLDRSREQVAAGPSYDRHFRPDLSEERWNDRIDEHYGYVAERRPPEERTVSPASGRRGFWLAALLVVLILVVGVAYIAYNQGWSSSTASVEAAASSLRRTSADVATTVKVKTALALSKRVSAYDVDVDTNNGIVTLSGHVASEDIKELAGEIARDTSGVERLQNALVVDPGVRTRSDTTPLSERVTELEARIEIKEAIESDPELRDADLTVRFEKGRAVLEGEVQMESQKSKAEEIARSVEGVQEVENRIVISATRRL